MDSFSHKINVDKILEETGFDIKTLCARLGITRRVVNSWSKSKEDGGSRPDFNAVAVLLEAGATVETLYGVEYKKMHREFIVPHSTQDVFSSPEFMTMVNAKIQEIKKKNKA